MTARLEPTSVGWSRAVAAVNGAPAHRAEGMRHLRRLIRNYHDDLRKRGEPLTARLTAGERTVWLRAARRCTPRPHPTTHPMRCHCAACTWLRTPDTPNPPARHPELAKHPIADDVYGEDEMAVYRLAVVDVDHLGVSNLKSLVGANPMAAITAYRAQEQERGRVNRTPDPSETATPEEIEAADTTRAPSRSAVLVRRAVELHGAERVSQALELDVGAVARDQWELFPVVENRLADALRGRWTAFERQRRYDTAAAATWHARLAIARIVALVFDVPCQGGDDAPADKARSATRPWMLWREDVDRRAAGTGKRVLHEPGACLAALCTCPAPARDEPRWPPVWRRVHVRHGDLIVWDPATPHKVRRNVAWPQVVAMCPAAACTSCPTEPLTPKVRFWDERGRLWAPGPGRPPSTNHEIRAQILLLRGEGKSVRDVAKELGLDRGVVYRVSRKQSA